ncbi:DEAD/DEAH box helicase [Rhodococcus sp. H36-A4]|uniref:DEAD/DEAH box helicase n=1 Tax=Rhodococcus sp. H36-A4 TaxID=3004353 RepID=UPI0022AF008A|nr:DEAD/DEAH box helicase [Rhodococcus sp. H36-A4]MCZ4080099.1 DEAD/DEAH box helicase [Rhodococcus sp. H36-A4]
MTIPTMDELEVDALEIRFGTDTFTRGSKYFEEGRVGQVTWDRRASTLSSRVRGNRATPYSTVATMSTRMGAIVAVEYGRCNCPVVFNCKHAVALILQAKADSVRTPTRGPVNTAGHWSQVLASVISAKPAELDRPSSGRIRVGLQLGLEPSVDRADAIRLLARPVMFNERKAWVGGGVSWSSLPSTTDRRVQRQVDILRELYALHQVRSRGRSAYSFQRTDSATIDLADISGRLLWDLLGEAREVELPLINAHRILGEIPWPGEGEFTVDITSGDSGSLSVVGRITLDSTIIPPNRRSFLGNDGSGIVYWDDEAHTNHATREFRLARLSRPVPSALRRIATTIDPIEIPSSDRADFTTKYLPALERASDVVSSDGSYTAPVVTGPELHITVTHTGDNRLTFAAQWRYYLDSAELDYPADVYRSAEGIRDPDSEVALLRRVLPVLSRPPGNEFISFTAVGIAAGILVTDQLPLLNEYDNVYVTTVGELPDFRNVSDDVGISLSTNAIRGDNDWFDLGIAVTVDGTDVELATVITAIARGETHLMLSDGRFFSLERSSLLTLRRLVEEARSLQDNVNGPLRISRYQASLWEELAELGEVTRQATAWREQVTALLKLDSIPPQPAPAGIGAQLRPYQLEGYSWLLFLWTHGLGGILADDMGLGKTIQALAMITKIRESGTLPAPFLIVAPTSVVHNWAKEAEKFAPDLNVVTAGETRARRRGPVGDIALGADIVVTSYTVFRLDYEDFEAVSWSGLILDEAQYVKNHKSKSYQCARRLSAPYKLAITGTPMENNVMELWSLLSITAPGLFPSPKKFTDNYRNPIEKDGDTEQLRTLRRRIKPLVLRRSKDTVVQDLPPKQEQTVEVDLHPRHQRVYETRLARERQKILGLLDDFQRNRVTILQSLTTLRQLSLDASLVDEKHSDIPSAKIDELVDQLHEIIEGGHRALVFSQFTRFLALVRDRLESEGIALVYLDGSTRNRGDVVERFRSGEAPVFLISLKAGGVGLTLTEADYCFVLDPWWNPATEAQAVDRAHRIGQARTVFVNRYVARGTIEEKVMQLKERKAKLFASVMDDGGAFAGGLTADDIRGLIE